MRGALAPLHARLPVGRAPHISLTAAATSCLILLRHGQSEWNLSNRFTGWADVPLTDQGRKDALYAGNLLCDAGVKVDIIFSSGLERSIETAEIVRDRLQCDPRTRRSKPVQFLQRHRLNERHYGALTGLDKREVPCACHVHAHAHAMRMPRTRHAMSCTCYAQALATIDAAELTAWRSTFDGRPPPLEPSSPCYAEIAATEDAARKEGLPGAPLTESIRDCCRRVEPLWQKEIRPAVLRRGKVG